MKRSTDRILTTHVGSLPRQPELIPLLFAKDSGQRPERLLMVDYQQLASDDETLPALSDVFAAYGSWKRARRAAAESK